LKTLFFKSLPSTQLYLKALLKEQETSLPLAIVADIQTAGIGSRDNSWVSKEGNLFLSFAIELDELVSDLKLESASIYFSYILKETLAELGSASFLKWPNDLYLNNKKIAGMITNIVGDVLVCGVGLNLQNTNEAFGTLDIDISREEFLKCYFANIKKKILWKQVFSKYKLEFQTKQKIFTHINGKKTDLSQAVLEDDGSLTINGERIYSLR